MATASSKKKKSRGRVGGLGNVQKRSKQIEDKKGGTPFLKIEDGESVILRVLDTGEDFKDGFVHPVEYEYEDDNGKTQTRTMDVMCLDQDEKGVPCPGCADDLDRRYKFWTNVIAREHGDDEEDVVAIWSGGITVARRLDKMAGKHDLKLRDIEVEREGVKLKTKYDIDWADDEDSELSKADKQLAKKKADLAPRVKIRDFDDFYKSPREMREEEDDDDDVGERSRRRGSSFGKSGKSSSGKSKKKSGGLAAARARADKKASGGKKAKPSIKKKRR